MLVFDVRKRASFDHLKAIATSIRSQHGDKPPMLFVGHRASENGKREVTETEGKALAKEFQGSYKEVPDNPDQKDVGVVFSTALPQQNI